MKPPISTAPDVLGGTPVFAGTRVPIQTLFDYLEGGESVDDNEDVKLTSRSRKELTITNAGPAKFGNCGNVVAVNVAGEPTIDAFVELQPHKAVSIKRSLAISRKETT